MPRKLKKLEERSVMPQNRMESVPGSSQPRSERTPHPDFVQMQEDIEQARSSAMHEESSRMETLREEISAPDVEGIRRDLEVLKGQAAKLQEQFEADGIGSDIYSIDDPMDAAHRLASKSRKNAGGWSKFMSRLGSALTGNPADPEFFDEMLGRYNKLKELEESITVREEELQTIIKPKRRSTRVRSMPASDLDRNSPMYGHSFVPSRGMELASMKQDIAESIALAKNKETKKARQAITETAMETEGMMTPEEANEMEVQRATERAAAQEMREAGKLGKRGQSVEEFEQSFGINEEPEAEAIPLTRVKAKKKKVEAKVEAPKMEAPEREQLSKQEMQAIKRFKDMAAGLETLRLELQDANTNGTALENQTDFQERMKLFENGIETLIEANLDSTSDELYDAVVAAQGGLSDVKNTYNTVYAVLQEEIKSAGKGKRSMGVAKSGGRSMGGASYGTSASTRSAMVQNFAGPKAVSEEAWQKQLASHKEGYKKHQQGIKAQEAAHAASQGVEIQNVPELYDEYSEQARRAEMMREIGEMQMEREAEDAKAAELDRQRAVKAEEAREALGKGIHVERVKNLRDQFSEEARRAEMMADVGKMQIDQEQKATKKREAKEAKKSGIEVRKVEKITDPFAERQSYYEQNADLMKWAMENKSLNAADLWERANQDLEKIDSYDRSELATILGNAPDLAAAYVLALAKIAQGDDSYRPKVLRANLVLGRNANANLGMDLPQVSGSMAEDIKNAGQKIVRGRKKTA